MANRGAPCKQLDECLSSGSSNKRPKGSDSNKTRSFSNKVVGAKDGHTDEKKIASSVKKFLELGFLDGVAVICFPHKPDVTHSDGTSGIIIGSKIHCLCEACKGLENHKMCPTIFEMHAGCRKKNPADNFYLDDWKTTLKIVMDECKGTRKQFWGGTIKEQIGRINGQRIFDVCKTCEENDEPIIRCGLRLPTDCGTSQGSAQPREESLLNMLAVGSAPKYFGDYKSIGSRMTDDEVLGLCFEDNEFCEYFSG